MILIPMELDAVKSEPNIRGNVTGRPAPGNALWAGFHASAMARPDRPALEVGGQVFSYAELHRQAASIAATLKKYSPADEPALTAVFAYRSVTAFAGVLGALFRGHGYVPLNRTFPTDRTRLMRTRSRARAVIIDGQSEPQLESLLADCQEQLVLIFPEREEVQDLISRWPQHVILGRPQLEPAENWSPETNPPAELAYVLFTSGSTGVPKGVMVSQANVRHYVAWTVERYGITAEDRCSQTFDMTFDLSAHDMFVTWERGACLCCPTQKHLIKPGAFINDSRLTVWFSVPSTAIFMRRLGALKPDKYPGLRLSLFCGEALPVETAREWGLAAPNSVVENIYGPTELTIACTAYRWDPVQTPKESEQGTVPIGYPFRNMETLVVDEALREVEPGADGELLMAGPQVSLGYWDDKQKTEQAFVVPPGRTATFYRTGDRVRRPKGEAPLLYLGRVDNQIKILGHRVELGEVEAAIRQISGVDGVVALGWPKNAGGADAIVAFLETNQLDIPALQEKLKVRLPVYMLPREIRLLSPLPLNSNGKYDRKALNNILDAQKV